MNSKILTIAASMISLYQFAAATSNQGQKGISEAAQAGEPTFCTSEVKTFIVDFMESFKRRQMGILRPSRVLERVRQGLGSALDARFPDWTTVVDGTGAEGCQLRWYVDIVDGRFPSYYEPNTCRANKGNDLVLAKAFPNGDAQACKPFL